MKRIFYILLFISTAVYGQELVLSHEMGDEAARRKINNSIQQGDSIREFVDPVDSSALFNYMDVESTEIGTLGDSVQIEIPGDYMVWYTFSFSGTTQDSYHIAIFKNQNVTGFESHRTTSTNDIGNVSLIGYFDDLVSGDVLSCYIYNSQNNNDATFISSQWIIRRIH